MTKSLISNFKAKLAVTDGKFLYIFLNFKKLCVNSCIKLITMNGQKIKRKQAVIFFHDLNMYWPKGQQVWKVVLVSLTCRWNVF